MTARASVPCTCHALRSCTCQSVVSVDEARNLVLAAAMKAAKRVYPNAGDEATRVMAQCLLARARDQLNKNPAGES